MTLGVVFLAACGSSSPTPQAQASTTTRPAQTTSTTVAPASTTTPTAPAASTAGWAEVSTDVKGTAVEERTVTVPSGRVVTLVRFDAGHVVYDLHVGSSDPPTDLATIAQDRGPAIAADEAPFLLAAFNAGFKMNADQGGVEVDGQVVAPLLDGKASFVIDTDGTAHIGVWGSVLPAQGEQVESVRQNLPPLITDGVPNPTVGTPSDWGATVNSSMVVARSAAGEDAQGDILYAGGMALLPADLAAALLDAGAVNAMQLDINPNWVQLDTAAGAGLPLVAGVPGQNRPADQYQVGWTRDFFAVLAPTWVPPAKPR